MSKLGQVSEVMAFAASNPDYWTEFLGGQDYKDVLSQAEMNALEAARLHIEDAIYELLSLCGKVAAERLKDSGIVPKTFQPKATKQNRLVELSPPTGAGDRLYRLTFALTPDDDNEYIRLYVSMVAKKAHVDKLQARMAELGVQATLEGYNLYAPGIVLSAGKPFYELASEAVDALAALLRALG